MLIHHIYHASNPPDIYLTNMTSKKNNKHRECFHIQISFKTQDNLFYNIFCSRMPLSDVTPLLQYTNLGKPLSSRYCKIQLSLITLLTDSMKATDLLMTLVTDPSLANRLTLIRKKKYDEMVMTSCSSINPF